MKHKKGRARKCITADVFFLIYFHRALVHGRISTVLTCEVSTGFGTNAVWSRTSAGPQTRPLGMFPR